MISTQTARKEELESGLPMRPTPNPNGRGPWVKGRVRGIKLPPGIQAMHDEEARQRPITRAMVLRLLGRLAPYKLYYAIVCAFGLCVAGLEMIPPRLVGHTIDLIGSGHFTMPSVYAVALIWGGVVIVMQLMHAAQIALANRFGERVIARLRQDIFNHLQRLSMNYYDRTHLGRIIARASNDVDSVRGILIWGLNTLLSNAVMMICAAFMIFSTDHKLFWATVWLAPVMTALNFWYGRKAGEAWQLVRRHSTLLSANQAENISGVRVVAAFNRQEQNLEHFCDLQDINTRNNIAASRLGGLFQPALQWVRFGGQAIILIYGGYRVAMGDLRAGELVATTLYWEWFMQPATNFGSFFNDLMVAMAGAERLFSLLDEKPAVMDVPGAEALPRLSGNVRFEQVSFSYHTGRRVLSEVDFEAPAGSTVALVGATGSGKSTIISLLARFYHPDSGRILVDRCDIRLVTGASLHQQTAMVLQSNYLFTGTVLDNLRYARPHATLPEVIAAAKALGCHERFLELKDGYHTAVGERGAALSLGERQLICFTRALVADPRILLLDEATSAVDAATEREIQGALSRLVADRTTFIVAHRMSTIVNADLILVIDRGRIIERGTHAALLAREGKYAELYAHHTSSRHRGRGMETLSYA